jgi:uncharacterized protein YraI
LFMHSRTRKTQGLAPFARRHWLLLTVAGLAFLALLAGQPALAADVRPDVNQTVPPPTPRPSSDNNNNNNDNNDNNNNDSNNQSDNGGAASSQTETPAVAATETATGALTAVVQVVSLNVRQGPGTAYPVVGKLAEGSEVTVDGRNDAGDWWSVCCIAGSDTRGWVSAALVTPNFAAEQAAALPVVASEPAPEATPAPTATPAAGATGGAAAGSGVQGTVAGVNLNVRSGPSTDDAVLGKLRGSDTVTVLGRNASGDWLYICCIGTPASNGWVSAQFVTPAFAAGDIPEVGSDGQPGTGTGAAAAVETPAAGGEGAQAAEAAGTGALSVAVSQQPPFAVQGREIALVYTVRNDGAEDLANVVLSSELPGPLALIGATAGAGGEVAQAEGSPAVTVTWATLPAGGSATATVRVRVAGDVPNGTTFANLASVTAGNGETASSGITIGMPPSLLPEFW